MGWDDVFQKKESSRVRSVKSTPIKKANEKSRTTTDKTSSSQASNNTFFDSLKRVQGALSPASKSKSTNRQDVKRNRPILEVPAKSSDKLKDKDRDRTKDKEKDKEKEKRSWFRSPSRSSLKKEVTKSSTSLNANASAQKLTQKKRPLSAFPEANITHRRGQATKIEGHTLGDNLSRASSVTNLDADQKAAKGARPRKSSSRERLDRIGGDGRKQDKKGIARNNNKLESEENTHFSVDSFTDEELLLLRKQLQDMAQEKTNLALQLGEQKGQLNILQKEIQKLKEESNMQLEHLTEENTLLRNRLRDVALSPLSDNEKQQLLFDSHRHHSSAPASIATNIIDDGNGQDTTCTTPDWDKHSSSNVSEVSVACLQDKINQMQETHYSTNEELQATLQELTDLQRQLTELQQENERLNEEKTLMFDSLCRQTERLNDSRSEVESLKQLLYQEKDDTGQFESAVEREQKLVDLLKSAQEEREGLLMKLEQLTNELQETRAGIIEKDDHIGHLRERVRTLECTLDAKHAEHKLLDQELAQAKDQCSGKQIEINRLTDLLDNARTKINELEQDRTLSDKSELDELLDNARKEKDSLESEVAHLKEQLAISKNEIEKLREQVSILQEECKVTRNNAKTTQSDLEYKCEKLVKDKNVLNEQLQEFQEALNELQVQSQCQLEDKRQLSAVLSETQRNLSEAERRNLGLENEVDELKRLRSEENEEWEKFQDDLLTSVRVANDFKTEAQHELQRMILENKSYRDRERQLKAEIEKLKGGNLKLEADKENMELLIKRPNRNRNKPTKGSGIVSSSYKPKKDSGTVSSSSKPRKDSGTLSSSSKSDKSLSLPQNLSVKRRENKSLKAKRLKTLSVEEGMLLSSLDNYHRNIDKTLPDEFLTEEEKVIRKLKIIFEDDFLKVKPVAPKPKDQLAISKPLLDSVLTNPKLMAILKDPKVKTVEDMATFEKDAPEIRNLIQNIDRSKKGQSEDLGKPEYTKRISIIGRSMSCDHVNRFEDPEGNLRLYRTTEAEDLTQDVRWRESSSLVPSDSASNYNRYSDFSLVVNSNENIIKDNVKYSTLERIVKTIPKNAPEAALNKEQLFALKLLQALEERKRTLKKSEKAKTLPISVPTPDSVLQNQKLKEIIYDPNMQDIRRKSEPLSPPVVQKLTRQSQSYENITFRFEDRSHAVNVYLSDSESSSETFSSAEFNVETGQTGPYEPIEDWRKPPGTPKVSRKMELTTFGKNSVSNIEQKNKTGSKMQLLKDELDQLSQPISLTDNKKHHIVQTRIEIEPNGYKERHISTINLDDHKYRHRDDIFLDRDLVDQQPSQGGNTDKSRSSKYQEEHTYRQKEDTFKSRDKVVDSLLYNETLTKKGKTVALEGDYKVDLLQEKIKKKTKKEQSDVKPQANISNENKNEIKYETDDGETEKNVLNYTKVDKTEDKIPIILHVASIETLEGFQSHDTDSLTYNETLTRAISRRSPHPTESKNEPKTPLSIDEPTSSPSIVEPTPPPSIHEPTALPYINEPTYPPSIVEPTSPSVDEAIKNISEKFQEIRKLITEDDEKEKPRLDVDIKNFKQENRVLEHLSTKADDFVAADSTIIDEIDGSPNQSTDYDYHSILKENRVGVTCPLNHRLSYNHVVNEIRKRFSSTDFQSDGENEHNAEEADDERDIDDSSKELEEANFQREIENYPEQIENSPEEIKNSSEEIDEQGVQIKIDNVVKNIDEEEDVEVRARSSSIDKEMDDILESYLHTRVSQLIKQTEGKPSKTIEHSVYSDFDRKLNEIVQGSFNIDDLDSKKSSIDSINQTEFEDKDIMLSQELLETLITSDESKEIPYKNLEPELADCALQFEENKAKDYSKLSPTELTFSDDSYFEIKEGNVTNIKASLNIDAKENINDIIESTNKFIDDQRKISIKYPISNRNKNSNDFIEDKEVSSEPIKPFLEYEIVSLKKDIPEQELKVLQKDVDTLYQVFDNDKSDIHEKRENTSLLDNNPVSTNEMPDEKSFVPPISIPTLPEYQILTKEELELVRRSNQRFPRPLSEFNEHDLELVKAISIYYEDEPKEIPIGHQTRVETKLEINEDLTIEEQSLDNASDAEILLGLKENPVKDVKKEYTPSDRRPLSNLNQRDLELIEKLTKDYLLDADKSKNDSERTVDLRGENKEEDLPKQVEIITKDYLLDANKCKNDFERIVDLRRENIEGGTQKQGEIIITKEPLPKPRKTKDITKDSISSKTDIEPSKNLEIGRKKDPIPMPRNKKDAADDLETLLTQMSSPRRKVIKRRLISEKTAPAPSESVIEPIDKPEVVQAKEIDLEGFEENNTRSVDDINIVIGVEETAKENEDENDGILESVKSEDKGLVEIEMNKTKLTNHKSDADDSRANTLRKKREMHVILYRNNKPNSRQNAKSLTLSVDDNNTANELNKNRLSLDLTKSDADTTIKEKKVKSFAQHFERISQERSKYAQKRSELKTFEVRKKLPEVPSIGKTDKKPIPIPRIKNQGTKDPVNDDSYADDKNNEVLRKMSQCEENFSGNDRANVKKETEAAGVKFKVHDKVDKVNNEVPGLNESQNLVIDDYSSISTDEDEGDANSIEDGVIRKSDKFLVDRMPVNDDDYLDDTDGAKGSYSVIAVAGTAEKLDLRKPSNLTVEPSSLNLFHLDASSMEDHYIDATNFSYERRKKIGATYIGITDSDNDTLESTDSKPKIVDFVPLDEATKPYYKNNNIPDYSTLEREKTYQILNAVSKGKLTEAAVESTATKNDSRSSFSAAKKIFQDLESKSDKTGVNKVTITKRQSKDLLDNPEESCTESTTHKLGIELALEATTKPAQEKIDEI